MPARRAFRNPARRRQDGRCTWKSAQESTMIHHQELRSASENRMPETIQPHILVVDDDPQIRDLLKEYLTQNELRVSITATGREMSAILTEQAIDLVVLDLRLAGEDGMTLARKLREESAIPVIILTGVRDEADRIMGLELGADDYLTKPFSPRELLARIRTVLRRTKGAALTEARQGDVRAYRFAEFELNLRTRRLTRHPGKRLELTNGEFNLLAALLAAPQRILTRDQLLEASRVYDNEVYDRSIDVQVLRLRRKIENDPSQPQFILTERGVGYSFSAPVEVLH
jgi:two-component system OmpR family response regulator